VSDFGAGTGRLAHVLAASGLDRIRYCGLERDPLRLRFAISKAPVLIEAVFTTDLEEFVSEMTRSSKTALVIAFCLHDQRAIDQIVDLITDHRPHVVLVWDLTPRDLPRLTASLRAGGLAVYEEARLRVHELAAALMARDMSVTTYVQQHEIIFPNSAAMMDYVRAFGLDRGDDLHLTTTRGDVNVRTAIERTVASLSFPFTDLRHFMGIEVAK
jgi:hypothetical protein